jgi:ribosomal protein L29
MADTKTTKATKSVKTTKVAAEVKTPEQLKTDLLARKNDLLEAKRGHRAGELTNPRVITLARKDIARLHTALRALVLKEKK